MIMGQDELGTKVQPRSEIERLKNNWANDPCWDIEDTEGFETHFIELKAFRLGCDLYWSQECNSMIKDKARELNCSLELAQYILNLENTINELKIELWG